MYAPGRIYNIPYYSYAFNLIVYVMCVQRTEVQRGIRVPSVRITVTYLDRGDLVDDEVVVSD